MGESVLAVHPPHPLMTTDIGLPHIFSSPGIVTRLHAAQEMGESVLAVHPPRPLTNTQVATANSYASYSTPRHPCFGGLAIGESFSDCMPCPLIIA